MEIGIYVCSIYYPKLLLMGNGPFIIMIVFLLYEEFGIHRGLITEKFPLFFRVHARKCQRNQLMRICEHYGLKTPASRLLLYCYTFTSMYNVDYKTGCKISSDNGIIATG